ncbi:hypothetical protein CHS0354_029017, partial [Potamilus streckersoni]
MGVDIGELNKARVLVPEGKKIKKNCQAERECWFPRSFDQGFHFMTEILPHDQNVKAALKHDDRRYMLSGGILPEPTQIRVHGFHFQHGRDMIAMLLESACFLLLIVNSKLCLEEDSKLCLEEDFLRPVSHTKIKPHTPPKKMLEEPLSETPFWAYEVQDCWKLEDVTAMRKPEKSHTDSKAC